MVVLIVGINKENYGFWIFTVNTKSTLQKLYPKYQIQYVDTIAVMLLTLHQMQ